jgi:phosphoglycolate phosphatase-like HAD superfamily hydrolase
MDMTCALSSSALFVGVLTGSYDRRAWSLHSCPALVTSISELPAFLGLGKV